MTTLSYNLNKETEVSYIIYDIMGHEVKTLVNSKQVPGLKRIQWNSEDNYGKKVSSGIYVSSIKAGGTVLNQKITLIK